MAKKLPPPLVPIDVDLRNFEFMPLDVVRLRQSDIAANEKPAAFRAAVLLWCAAWHGTPAGSLPNDDKALARIAMLDIRAWVHVKSAALRGFTLCGDSKLYHKVVSAKAIEAWDLKQRKKALTHSATKARLSRNVNRNEPRNDDRDENRNGQRDVHDTRQDKTKGGARVHAHARASLNGTVNGHDPDQWRLRLKHFADAQFWNEFWGPKPSEPSCYAPQTLLVEFGFRT